MLRLFRTNQLVVHALVLVYLAVLWLPAYLLKPGATVVEGGFVFVWVRNLLPEGAGWGLTLALVLVWFQGLVMNINVNEARIGPQVSLFPGLMIALWSSLSPEFYGFTPWVLANTFASLALHEIRRTYRNPEPSGVIFNTGFLLSLAALSHPGYLAFVVAGWVGLGIMHTRHLRVSLQYLTGAVIPWFLLWLLYYWSAPDMGFSVYAGLDLSWPPVFSGTENLRMLVQLVLLLTLTVWILSLYRRVTLGETMQAQKNVQVLYWLMLAAGLSIAMTPVVPFTHALVLTLPVGTIAGLWLVRQRPSTAEMVHFLVVAGVVIYQYFPLVYI